MSKEMWLPTTETRVTVDQAGNVNVWDEMTMELRKPPRTGFTNKDTNEQPEFQPQLSAKPT